MAVLKKESKAYEALVKITDDDQFAQFDLLSTLFQLVSDESSAHPRDFSKESTQSRASRRNSLTRPSISFVYS